MGVIIRVPANKFHNNLGEFQLRHHDPEIVPCLDQSRFVSRLYIEDAICVAREGALLQHVQICVQVYARAGGHICSNNRDETPRGLGYVIDGEHQVRDFDT